MPPRMLPQQAMRSPLDQPIRHGQHYATGTSCLRKAQLPSTAALRSILRSMYLRASTDYPQTPPYPKARRQQHVHKRPNDLSRTHLDCPPQLAMRPQMHPLRTLQLVHSHQPRLGRRTATRRMGMVLQVRKRTTPNAMHIHLWIRCQRQLGEPRQVVQRANHQGQPQRTFMHVRSYLRRWRPREQCSSVSTSQATMHSTKLLCLRQSVGQLPRTWPLLRRPSDPPQRTWMWRKLQHQLRRW